MARADLILNLVRASCLGDRMKIREAVEALAANERAKKHTVLADRLLAQLQSGNGHKTNTVSLAKASDRSIVYDKIPGRGLDDLVLLPLVVETVRRTGGGTSQGRFTQVLQP